MKLERHELPRVLDVVFAGLNLLKHRRRCRLRHLVLDFKNAFFQFLVALEEQRLFVARLKKYIHVYVWNRCVQGSRGAPLVCGRALALAMRLSMGLIEDGTLSASTYVDDPISTYAGGDESEHEEALCVSVAGLLALGYDLAFDVAWTL